MLLEVSEKGALVQLDRIPIPNGMDMHLWLRMYLGMGFVVTAQPENVRKIVNIFEEAGIAAAKIGEITGTRKLEITNNAETVVVWDFAQDTIMGIGAVACR